MVTITILPEKSDQYRALSGDKESVGRTAGEALDALTSQLTGGEGGPLVIVQTHKPDRFFDAAQQERLANLMRLREAGSLTAEEERELEGLIEAELGGARERAEGMMYAVGADERPTNPAVYKESARATAIRESVLKLLADLTAEKRRIIVLWIKGMRYKEIADTLGIGVGGVALTVQKFQISLLKSVQESPQEPLPPSEEIDIPHPARSFIRQILSSAREEGSLDG